MLRIHKNLLVVIIFACIMLVNVQNVVGQGIANPKQLRADKIENVTTTQYNSPANPSKDQIVIKLIDGDIRYYNADTIELVKTEDDAVYVTPCCIDGFDKLPSQNIAEITFRQADTLAAGKFTNSEGKVEIIESRGWFESAFVKFGFFEGAETYHVYIKGEDYKDYTRIDYQLVRKYPTFGRADMVGLRAGKYAMKVVPVIGGKEMEDCANEASDLDVRNYLRTNFAHFKINNNGVGAYNSDGTLKSNAKVLYVTKETAKTVKATVITSSKGGTTEAQRAYSPFSTFT